MEYDESDYEPIRIIGTGSYGRVKLVKKKNDSVYYAEKTFKKFEIMKLNQIQHIYSEYILLKEIDHPFIIKLKGIRQDDKYLCYLLEYIPGGELFSLLRLEVIFLPEKAKFYASQLILAFVYLHSKDIVYRDLKPENIIFNFNGYIKLIDFGLAKRVTDKTFTMCGTPEYLAPEIILNKGHSKPVDWWTLGILLYEMMVGIDPFNDEDPLMIYKKILHGKIKFPLNFDKNAKSFIRHLLVADTTVRLGSQNHAQDVFEHRWFKDYDWEALISMNLPALHIPKIRSVDDTSNYADFYDSDTEVVSIKKEQDPFLDWGV